jgi:hypothetical protein
MTDAYVIEKGIPIPRTSGKTARGTVRRALDDLFQNGEIGDSILFHDKAKASDMAGPLQAAGPSGWYVSDVEEGGVRIWKTAERKRESPAS